MALPTIRVLISPCRSGSTAFMRSMAQNPDVHCFFQPIKEGVREGKSPSYSIFDGTHKTFAQNPGKIFFIKETFGHAFQEECCFEAFPNQESVVRSRSIFLLRDPVETWSSWKKLKAAGKKGWEGVCDFNLFKTAYKHTHDTFMRNQDISDQITCLTREHLLENPYKVFQLICSRWDIPFTDNMIHWTKPFDVNDISCGEGHQETFTRLQHKDMRESTSFYAVENNKDRWQNSLVTSEEREEIEMTLKPLHEKFAALSNVYYPLGENLKSA
ncbi:MAG: hypothetical protein KME25_10085 [Symplocastrum torsivum CPER-KK1]|uniref:Sulfotransferase domain-containing protein n=1 Tax=Symplocastrum torsivum CPER-KK1 TaxID=450513 RepID=A0A951PKD2_9CYAN|nr:hypothetical protein [Symplocastrum torsivum CPER-KK1]